MEMEKEFYLIRHGQTDFNKRGIIQGGGIDSSLNDTGWAQAHAFHQQYKQVSFDLIVTSDLRRTHKRLLGNGKPEITRRDLKEGKVPQN
jgi:probable phosphoglycerate mutase